jgi:hypothetical protein
LNLPASGDGIPRAELATTVRSAADDCIAETRPLLAAGARVGNNGVMQFQASKVVSLKGHPSYNEKWLQQKIAEDPTVLGIGDLIVKDVERTQPRAGRLDLLLADPEAATRYEVEIQLGQTDEAHIIRTIEYWDIERRRYPQYDHVAVIVAEDITSRFLNVISLFNGFIPLIAIQLQALAIGDVLTLHAAKVMDVTTLGLVDDEDEAGGQTDRNWWESNRGSAQSLALADRMLSLVHEVAPELQLKYNKNYLGLARDGVADNFVSFQPRQAHLIAAFRIPRSDELTARLDEAGVELLAYNRRSGKYRLRLSGADIVTHHDLLLALVQMAHGSPPTPDE